ncbi:hypothetical protein AB4Z38_09540 [Arthrobacter sp. 2RAF6]|uniref:hypothetical protein n=1 Tax=Arthrobacter sp. 2RAF6 TaxID=3233002 RepID=UPI003F90B2D6
MTREQNILTTFSNARSRGPARNTAPSLVSALIAALLLFGVTGCAILPGRTNPMTSDPDRPYNGTRTADTVRNDFYDTIDDTVKQTGLTFPDWNRADPKRISRDTCAIGSKAGKQFSIDLRGGASPDPKAAVEKIRAYWESKNWTIESIIDHTDAPNPGMQIAATSPTGILVVYNPTKNNTNPGKTTDWSSISVESDCTLDPSLNGVPTPRTSPPPSTGS